jgi:DNA-binding transcriptional MerR regulator
VEYIQKHLGHGGIERLPSRATKVPLPSGGDEETARSSRQFQDGEEPVAAEDSLTSANDLDDEAIARIEASHASGLTSQAILDSLDGTKFKISEATLRKWVQLGLLPRSVRVGRKGKHQGSQGMYPVGVVRQIKRIKEMMALDFTIEEIQREFLFARSDIEETERTLNRAIDGLERAIVERAGAPVAKMLERDIGEARDLAERLVDKLTEIENRLTMQARLRRAAV